MLLSDKVTILLADEDALRRDGLAAVLRGTSQFEIVAQCPDGEAALEQIRKLRPDVAVVDLNLPGLHGIELVRRVRGETLGTKVVILSSTADDEIIREVVRAGGDGYLLKNGPSRHLIDAISYVRDGGQYFSPQLRRDGRDRHLPVNRGNGRTSDPQRLRERLRETPETGSLDERDYDILTMMADGIRPILDRLDEIEGRVGEMETGDAPVPSNVRGWLNTQIADTFEKPGATTREVALARTAGDLEARLPQLIEDAVTTRFHNMASKLQQEIEETHVRTLETFVKNIQVKLVQRVSALETDMSKQAEAMNQLRQYSQRTEDNLSRLITGVDKLARELPKRLQAPEPVQPQPQAAPEPKRVRRKSSRSFSPIWVWIAIAVVVVASFGATRLLRRAQRASATASPGSPLAANDPGRLVVPAASADVKTKMQAAEQYTERKEYATAEDIYKQVLKAEPNNVDAMKALASVLYREDKIEESAGILDKLPRN